jgi:(2S)-methylsuccinyl-CoA dehydrogenase
MAGVAVTEPDFGSDVAGITVCRSLAATARSWVISGTKTWSTFAARADVLMLLARTDPDRSLTHRGLSMFVVPKERADGHGFVLTQSGGDGWKAARSTPSATGGCTPTSCPSTGGGYRPTT